jgi:hypothetical protein
MSSSTQKSPIIFTQYATSVIATIRERFDASLAAVKKHATLANLILIIAIPAAMRYVVSSLLQVVHTFNLVFIGFKTLFQDTENKPAECDGESPFAAAQRLYQNGHMSYRVVALASAGSILVLSFVIPPQSILFLVMNIPLAIVMLCDIARPIHTNTPVKTVDQSYWQYLLRVGAQTRSALRETWAYAAVCAPYIHQTLLSLTTQIAKISVIHSLSAYRLLHASIHMAYLPHMLSLFSVAGGVALMLQQQHHLRGYFQDMYKWVLEQPQVASLSQKLAVDYLLSSFLKTKVDKEAASGPVNTSTTGEEPGSKNTFNQQYSG